MDAHHKDTLFLKRWWIFFAPADDEDDNELTAGGDHHINMHRPFHWEHISVRAFALFLPVSEIFVVAIQVEYSLQRFLSLVHASLIQINECMQREKLKC